jgi:hypothetical protein
MEHKNYSTKINTNDIDFIAPVRLMIRRKTQQEMELLKTFDKFRELDESKSCLKSKTKSTCHSSQSKEEKRSNKKVSFKKNIQETIIVSSYKEYNKYNNFKGLGIKRTKHDDDENESQSCACLIF